MQKKQTDMKHLCLICLSAVFALCQCSRHSEQAEPPQTQSIDTIPMLILQIQKCSRLYTAEYNIHKIVTHNDEKRLKGKVFSKSFDLKMPVGDRKIAIPIHARLKAFIDFSHFSQDNVDIRNGKITIWLPDPQVEMTSSKVEQEKIKEFVSITRSRHTDEEMAAYELQGRQAIINSIPELGIVETARENAAHVLIPMIEQMGFRQENITIAFRKDFNPGTLGKNLLSIQRNNR